MESTWATMKKEIRHIYGGNVLDFRGAYKAVVANS